MQNKQKTKIEKQRGRNVSHVILHFITASLKKKQMKLSLMLDFI